MSGNNFALEKLLNIILFKHKQQASKKHIELLVANDIASPIILSADEDKLKWLLDFVLENTIDHSGASQILFSTRQLLRSDKEILLEFSLSDNGPGLKTIKKFAYYRTLVAARILIEEMHGKSELIISLDGATELRFIIKCIWKNAKQNRCEIIHELENKNILIAEDNEINQHAIMQMLKDQGIKFQLTSNGKEAIELLEKDNCFDLILMDLQMPYMDGFETTNYIRKVLKLRIPVVGMMAKVQNENEKKSMQADIDCLIKKPFAKNELLNCVSAFFRSEVAVLSPDVLGLNLKTA